MKSSKFKFDDVRIVPENSTREDVTIYADCKLLMEEYPKLPPRKLVEPLPQISFTSLDYPLRRQFYNLCPMLLSFRRSRASKFDTSFLPVVMTSSDVRIESYNIDNVHRFSRKLRENHIVNVVDKLRTEHLVPGQLSLFFGNFKFNHKRLDLLCSKLSPEEFIKILSPKLEEINLFKFYFSIGLDEMLSRTPNLKKLKMFGIRGFQNWETSLQCWNQNSKMIHLQITSHEEDKPLREIFSNPGTLQSFILRQNPSFKMVLVFSNVEESPDEDNIPEFYFYFQKVEYNLGEILSITFSNLVPSLDRSRKKENMVMEAAGSRIGWLKSTPDMR
ncbi:hypothetical protein FO519_001065 [Halicephalobus sp. NKZ332]|nr:hypothetical protein FO519_001065 [Halicephalobus sp. NKZ332]